MMNLLVLSAVVLRLAGIGVHCPPRDENTSRPSAKIRSNTFSGRLFLPVAVSSTAAQEQPNRCGLIQNCHVMGSAGLAS